MSFIVCRSINYVSMGFRPGYSTQDVLLYVTDTWRKAIDEGKYVGAIFLDLAKAFDCVNHEILLSKLSRYNIVGDVHNWISSYLENRTQQVLYKGQLSTRGNVSIGVPQGSILGPLLFSIYINDMPSIVLTSDMSMYADDIEMHCTGNDLATVEQNLQEDLHRIESWMISSRLKFNSKKSVVMLIGSRQKIGDKSIKITVSDTQLDQVSVTRYLGVMIDSHLTWDDHTNLVLNRTRTKLASIGRLKPLPLNLLSLIYKLFVLPIIDYCDIIWHSSNSKKAKQLERLRTKATYGPIPDVKKTRGLSIYKSLQERRKYHTLIAAYKVIHQTTPSYLHHSLRYASEVTQRTSRNVHRLFVPYIRTNYGKNSFYYRATTLWNNLDNRFYSAPDITHFKSLFN